MDDALLKQALHDSPAFRAALKRADLQFEEAVRQQDSAIKVIRSAVEDGARMAELLPRVADSVKPLFGANQVDPLYYIIADYNVRSGMTKSAGSQMLRELLASRRDEVDRVRGAKRAYERALDRYESALTKHALALKRPGDKRDPGSEAGDLATVRRSYYQCMVDWLEQLNGYKERTAAYWTEKAMVYFSILREGEGLLSHVYQSTDTPLPSPPPPPLRVAKKEFMGSVDREFDMSASMTHRLTEKYGYLFKKKTKGIGPPWRLAYLSIEHGLFRFWTQSPTTSASTNTHTSLATPVMIDDTDSSIDTNVLLCQIKLYDSPDRACCFEVSTPQRSYVFQALSEEDRMDWLRVFENSKNLAVRPAIKEDEAGAEQDAERVHELQLVEGLPEAMARICCRLEESFVFACDYVLFDGKVGTLAADVQTVAHFSPGTATAALDDGRGKGERVDWAEVEKHDLHHGHLSSSIKLQLVNREVDSPVGRSVQIVFLDAKQHAQQAAMLGELCKSLCGPRKASCTSEQLATFLYKRPTEQEQADAAVHPAVYPDDFVPPASADFEALLHAHQDNDLDHLELDATIAVPAPTLFKELFADPQGQLFKTLLSKRRNTELAIGPLERESDGDGSTLTRHLSYMIPLNNPIVKAKETKCRENMTIKTIRPNVLYLIDVTASTPDIMYGDAFVSRSRFVVSFKTLGSCRLRSWFGMRWSRTVLVKSIIRAAAQKGFSDYCSDLKLVIKEELVRKRGRAEAQLESAAGEASAEDLDERLAAAGPSYAAYVSILAGVLLAVYMFCIRTSSRAAPNFTATGFKPLTISMHDIVRQAVKTEEAVNRANYIDFLYKKLVGCSADKGAADCRLFQEEWNRIIKE